MLYSTVDPGSTVEPNVTVNFTCVTRGFPILDWTSNEYISMRGERIEYDPDCTRGDHTTPIDQNTTPSCLNASTQIENGRTIIIIESQLTIVTSAKYANATVSCSGNGNPAREDFTFRKCSYILIRS